MTTVFIFTDTQEDFSYGWKCPACGHTVDPMGTLGSREHGRCRSCGADSSRSLTTASETPAFRSPLPHTKELDKVLEALGIPRVVAMPKRDPEDQILRDEEGEPYANDWKPQP